MTSITPNRTCSQTGSATHSAPAMAEPARTTGMASADGREPTVQSQPGRRDRAGIELSLGTDVEGPGAEGEGDSQTDDDEGNRPHQRGGGEGIPRPERAAPESAEGGTRIEARELEPDGERGDAEGDRRDGDCGAPQPHRYRLAASISAPISVREVPAGASRRVPEAITTIRWDSASTSSRSLE